MTSIEDKLQTLQHKVSTVDKTHELQDRTERLDQKFYNKYIYVHLVLYI